MGNIHEARDGLVAVGNVHLYSAVSRKDHLDTGDLNSGLSCLMCPQQRQSQTLKNSIEQVQEETELPLCFGLKGK